MRAIVGLHEGRKFPGLGIENLFGWWELERAQGTQVWGLFGADGVRMHDSNGLRACILLERSGKRLEGGRGVQCYSGERAVIN